MDTLLCGAALSSFRLSLAFPSRNRQDLAGASKVVELPGFLWKGGGVPTRGKQAGILAIRVRKRPPAAGIPLPGKPPPGADLCRRW